MSLLSLWSNRINTANSRKHQEFAGRLNSVNNRAELYQHLKEENGFVLCIGRKDLGDGLYNESIAFSN